jgi:hypothetical protein
MAFRIRAGQQSGVEIVGTSVRGKEGGKDKLTMNDTNSSFEIVRSRIQNTSIYTFQCICLNKLKSTGNLSPIHVARCV